MIRLNVPSILFPLGQVVATQGAATSCTVEYLTACLARHVTGDWGNVPKSDAEENQLSVREGFRILSAYPLDPDKPCMGHGDNSLWIITEADRSVTTFLLPSEY